MKSCHALKRVLLLDVFIILKAQEKATMWNLKRRICCAMFKVINNPLIFTSLFNHFSSGIGKKSRGWHKCKQVGRIMEVLCLRLPVSQSVYFLPRKNSYYILLLKQTLFMQWLPLSHTVHQPHRTKPQSFCKFYVV